MSQIWININKNPNLDQKYWFTIHSSNGKTLTHSENYYNKKDCIDSAVLIKQHASMSIIYDETGDIISLDTNDRIIG